MKLLIPLLAIVVPFILYEIKLHKYYVKDSEEVSKDDWELLQQAMSSPEFNQNLAELMKQESVIEDD